MNLFSVHYVKTTNKLLKYSPMKKMSYLLLVFLAGMLVVSCSQKEQLQIQDESTTLKSASVKADYEYVPNEILVKFKDGTEASKKEVVYAKLSGKVKEKILTKLMEKLGDKNGIDLVRIPGTVDDAIAKVKANPEVEYAEPNYVYHHDATSNDPYYTSTQLWGMNGTYGIGADHAWAAGHTGSASVAVGVIDEGIQYTHPDLDGQIWTNPYDAVDGEDNDGNGYVDDIHGWDFDGNNNSIYDGGTIGSLDDHGTHVSGTIGAKANTIGVVGVNWNVTIISAKFLGSNGGTTANAVKAVDYITTLKTLHPELNIVATNNSWGGGGFSQALQDAIERANTANILFVAAAGNNKSNNDRKANYPSNYKNANVIAVAAITSTGALASFSNYGATTVDLGAPGYGIWSTTAYNLYESYSGTSMATPHVTGACALYASTHTSATAAGIKAAILNAAIPTTSLKGKCVTGGRLDVSKF